MAISTADISRLRERSGAGMLDCKKALDETNGDFEAALDFLRKKGVAKAAKRADKIAAEGIVKSYIHGNGKIGVLVEVNSETDFVAKNELFLSFVDDIAMHIAAIAPKYLSRQDVPSEEIEKEKDIYTVQLQTEGKPADIIEKILEGKINKYYSDVCLLDQPFLKDEDKTIAQIIQEKTAEIGEKISIRRFARFVVGEGIEKESKNFASEVEEQLQA